MRSHNVLVVGVGVLACAVFAGCGISDTASIGTPAAPVSSAISVPGTEAEVIVNRKLWCGSVMDYYPDGTIEVWAVQHPENASVAELEQATGWKVKLELFGNLKDMGPQHPWAEYRRAVTADGLNFVTQKCSETGGGWVDMGLSGEVVNINGCLAVSKLVWDEGKGKDVPTPVIPIFGKWKSIAPSLRVGDHVEAAGMYVNAPLDDEDATIPVQCLNAGITEYFDVAELSDVNCLLFPDRDGCVHAPSPSTTPGMKE